VCRACAALGFDSLLGLHRVEKSLIATASSAETTERLDVLFVGSRGWGPARRAVLGSTSAELVHCAACPVVVMPQAKPSINDAKRREIEHPSPHPPFAVVRHRRRLPAPRGRAGAATIDGL